MLTTSLFAPSGLVAKDHSCVALRVHFWVDGDTAATAEGREGWVRAGRRRKGLRGREREIFEMRKKKKRFTLSLNILL